VEERIATTDNKLASVGTTANQAGASATQANTTASQALQQAQTNSGQIQTNSGELAKLAAAQTLTVVETGNVTFEVNHSDLSDAAKADLDLMRAEAVARYLVRQNIPMKNIALIGLGEEQTPQQLAAEVQGLDPNASEKQLRGLARRVRIRLYVPGSTTGTQASR
jgi:outer membrane protein OmpA-like peptidoglycan-associated protein